MDGTIREQWQEESIKECILIFSQRIFEYYKIIIPDHNTCKLEKVDGLALKDQIYYNTNKI